uniref:Enoyl reductase (ER) domain-containing protein n=1 Tax=Tetradesmus obliquus TaxID=3088 RepID=A0A383WH09_TETOB|eukprot:jgi/Sobl393_1/9494/SZX76512.1
MPHFPCPLGVDGAGVVVAIGSKVTQFKVGDHVLGFHQRMDEGSWSDIAAFEEPELAVKPAGVCWQLAAAAPVAGVTALSALLCCPALKLFYEQHSSSSSSSSSSSGSPLKSVLVLGASGGVGSFAVLLAKHYFRIPLVLATCSGRNAEYVQQLGADVVIDYTSQDVQAAVRDALQQQQQQQQQHASAAADTAQQSCGSSASQLVGAQDATLQAASTAQPSSRASCSGKLDLVVDNVGGSAHMSMACRLLTPSKGLYVTSVPLANPLSNSLWSVLSFFAGLMLRKALHCAAPACIPAVAFNGASPDGCKVQRLVDWLAAAGEVVHSSSAEQCLVRLTKYGLHEAGEALAAVQSNRAVGKLVLRVNGDL